MIRLPFTIGLVMFMLAGCASSVTLTGTPLEKIEPARWRTPARVVVADVQGDGCFRDEIARYLSMPGGLRLAADGERPYATLTGALERLEVHSNRGDKEVSLLYFTAFIVTAPIAAVIYGTKDWHADAAAEGRLVATDPAGGIAWQKELTVSISESQRTMPSDTALKTAMRSAVCRKLATTLLNGLTEDIATRDEQ